MAERERRLTASPSGGVFQARTRVMSSGRSRELEADVIAKATELFDDLKITPLPKVEASPPPPLPRVRPAH